MKKTKTTYKRVEGKIEFFQKATSGTTDSSIYAKGVVTGLSDVLVELDKLK